MPLQSCTVDGKPGYRWGESGACYTYDPDDDESKGKAKQRAIKQGVAIEGGSVPKNPSKTYEAKTCSECGKERNADKFPKDKRTRDGHASTCVECRFEHEYADELETVTLKGVDVLAAGGPYHGKGSPPEGDYLTVEDLEERAENTNRLIASGELKSYLKIGHSDEQRLLKNSGLLDDGEKPAAGWFENFRVEGGKLLADAKDVPRKIAKLVKTKAFRTRSVEMRSLASQSNDENENGKRHPVISAVALLGATLPAVRTLDDIAALYADVEADPPDEVEATLDYEEGDVVWNPNRGFSALQSKLSHALNGPPDGEKPMRYWVQDVARTLAGYEAIVSDWSDPAVAWVVPFAFEDDDVSPAPSNEWRMAEQRWVEVASGYAEEREKLKGSVDRDPANTRARMAKDEKAKTTSELSDEQVASLAQTFGIDESDDAKRRDAVVAKMAEFAPANEEPDPDDPDPAPEPEVPPAAKEQQPQGVQLSAAEIEALKAQAAAGAAVAEERRLEKREELLDRVISEARLDPAKREFWESEYDKNPDGVITLLNELPVNPEFVKVYGSDHSGGSDEQTDDAAYRAMNAAMGMTEISEAA